MDDKNGIYQESKIFKDVNPRIHTVFVKDINNGCRVVSELLSMLEFPKFFTPNGDTENDTWQVSGFSSQFPITTSFQIFDCYGKVITVLYKKHPKLGWNL